MQEAAEREVKKLTEHGILEKVEPQEKTAWISPAFFVPKPNDELRLVTDFTKLNEFVVRPVHPFMCTKEILNSIEAGSKVFCAIDCVKGYFQVQLDEESSRLTTMLLPWERYRYKRAPMGLSCSSDEWCARSDKALEGIGGCLKLVDDILVFDPDIETLQVRIKRVLQCCHDHGITISQKNYDTGLLCNLPATWCRQRELPHTRSD